MQTAGGTITVDCRINGQPFPALAFDVHSPTYGSGGHCDIKTSIEALARAKVDLISIAEQAPQGVPIDIYAADTDTRTHIFGGEYVKAIWDYDRSLITVNARDWSGQMMDEKKVLTKASGIETRNQTLTQIVTSIAQTFGLTPVLHLAEGDSTIIGSQFGDTDRTYMPRAQSAWATLTKLARDNGYEVHVSPDKELVFGEPGGGLPTLQLVYQMPPPIPDGQIPIWSPSFEHQPRRNRSFNVLVQSYNPATAQITKGQSTVIGSNLAVGSTTINAGQWSGPQASQASAAAAKSSDGKLPTYVFRIDGLTADQAQTKADAIARDIASRELIFCFHAHGILSIQPMQKLRVSGPTIEAEFAAHDYWASSFSHIFHMHEHRDHHATFHTEVKSLDIQNEGEGETISQTQTGNRGRPSGRLRGHRVPIT